MAKKKVKDKVEDSVVDSLPKAVRAVRAKFKCTYKAAADTEGNTSDIRLEVVTSGSAENEEFFKYTPSGKLEFGTINKAAADMFEEGKEYYLDFTAVPAPPSDVP